MEAPNIGDMVITSKEGFDLARERIRKEQEGLLSLEETVIKYESKLAKVQ